MCDPLTVDTHSHTENHTHCSVEMATLCIMVWKGDGMQSVCVCVCLCHLSQRGDKLCLARGLWSSGGRQARRCDLGREGRGNRPSHPRSQLPPPPHGNQLPLHSKQITASMRRYIQMMHRTRGHENRWVFNTHERGGGNPSSAGTLSHHNVVAEITTPDFQIKNIYTYICSVL